jgi:hypothetical protein
VKGVGSKIGIERRGLRTPLHFPAGLRPSSEREHILTSTNPEPRGEAGDLGDERLGLVNRYVPPERGPLEHSSELCQVVGADDRLDPPVQHRPPDGRWRVVRSLEPLA